MKSFFIKHKRYLLPALAGGVSGYLYYRLIGCTSGGCIIGSNSWISVSYGLLTGILLADVFSSKNQKKIQSTHE
jgi:hypothetical protein